MRNSRSHYFRRARIAVAWLVALATLMGGWLVGTIQPWVLRRQGLGRSSMHWSVMPDGRVWGLACQNGYLAVLETLDRPSALQVRITKWSEPDAWKVQLVRGPVAIDAGQRYVVRFRIRAEATRPFNLFVARPSTPVGQRPLSYRGEASQEWQNATLTFTTEETLADAQLCFELGESSATVELEDVELTADVDEGPSEDR